VSARQLGLLIALLGVVAVIAGLMVAAGAFRWFGHLPGDLRIEGERSRVYIPITSMLLVSLVANVVIALVRRFL
jgi:hypothetical protein